MGCHWQSGNLLTTTRRPLVKPFTLDGRPVELGGTMKMRPRPSGSRDGGVESRDSKRAARSFDRGGGSAHRTSLTAYRIRRLYLRIS